MSGKLCGPAFLATGSRGSEENETALPTGTTESIFLIAYLFLGPVAWGIYYFFMHLGRKRMMLMRRPPIELPGEKPTVTILIPAKDEGERTT